MPCSPYREAVSARLDGEPLGMLSRELDEHLADCPGCASWASDAAVVTRRAPPPAAPAVPDLTAAVLTALPREVPGAAAAGRARLADSALRLALVAVGVAQAVMAWPVLISGTGAMSAPVHMAHETGAWNLAVAGRPLPRGGGMDPGRGGRLPRGGGRPPPGDRSAAVPRFLHGLAGSGDPGRPGSRPRAPGPRGRPPAAPGRGRPGVRGRLAGAPPLRRPVLRRSAGARVRRARSLLIVLLAAWVVGGVAAAVPAAAHATLVSTDPAEGARLESMPAQVTLEFSEGVSLGAGYARVLGSDGARVDTGTASVSGRVLTIPVRAGLPDDGYLVSYRVISADAHPISGAYSFVVGNGEPVSASAAGAKDRTDPVVAAGLPISRWGGFAGLALAIGVPVLLLTCWPAGWGSPRLRRLAAGGAITVVVTAVL